MTEIKKQPFWKNLVANYKVNNLNNNKEFRGLWTILSISILFCLCFLSFRYFFSGNLQGVIGHNWDWTFPFLQSQFKQMNLTSTFTWSGINLGTPVNLNLSHIIPDTIISLSAILLKPLQLELFIILSVICLSFLNSKLAIDYIIGKSKINFIASFLYAFSPFIFNEVVGGSWYMWISYAFAPQLLYYHLKYIQLGSRKDLFYYLISSIFVISSLQNFVIIEAICFLYSLVVSKHNKKFYCKTITIYLSLIIFNIYWILPLLLQLTSFVNAITGAGFTGNFNSVLNSTQNIESIINMVGYTDRNIYLYSLSPITRHVFLLCSLAIFIIIIDIYKKNKFKKQEAFWIIFYILSILLIKGGNKPFTGLTMWLYNLIPFMSLYRSPQHLMFIPAFITPIMLSVALKQQKTLRQVLIISVCTLFAISGWWISGDIGLTTLTAKGKDSIRIYSLSTGMLRAIEQSETDKTAHRIAFIPTDISPLYVDQSGKSVGQGGQPEYMYLNSPTFNAENNQIADMVNNFFCNEATIDVDNLFSMTNTKYIFVRQDIVPRYTNCFNKWSINDVYNYFDSSNKYTKLYSDSSGSLYELDNQYFVQRFFVDQFGESVANISINQINPTKYILKLTGVRNSFSLIFLENFSKFWTIYPYQEKTNIQKPWSTPIAADHISAYGYANGWHIDPSAICSDKSFCQKGTDGTYNIELIVTYNLQQWFLIGCAMSIIFLFTIFTLGILKSNQDD